MTTTDPTPLAEQVAREHMPVFRTTGSVDRLGCSCQPRGYLPWSAGAFVQHIATVTERAVIAKLEEFAAAAEALARAEGHIWEDLADRAAGLREGVNHLRGDADA